MLTASQISDGESAARSLAVTLNLLGVQQDLNAGPSNLASTEDEARGYLAELASSLGYRIEEITPASVLKRELVESLTGRSEPSAELVAMREAVRA